jgi:hypothetical protein
VCLVIPNKDDDNYDVYYHYYYTPSTAEVKERVELYLYSPSVPSWPFLG